MNNKIKQLWDATTLSDRGMDLWNDYTLSDYVRTQLYVEDFAKLIIQKCGQYLDSPEFIGRSDLD